MIPHVNGLLVFIEMKQKNILRIGGAGKWGFFWVSHFQFFFFQKKKSAYLNENKQPDHMRYHLFLHYGWFLQNLGKYFIQTNMHMTVDDFGSHKKVSFCKYVLLKYTMKKSCQNALLLIVQNCWVNEGQLVRRYQWDIR